MGVAAAGDTGEEPRWERAWMLARRASKRDIAREETRVVSGSREVARKEGFSPGLMVAVSLLVGRDRARASELASARAIQSSVKLRHMLSAFRRTLRSMVLEPSGVESVLSEGVWVLVIAARANASAAVVSRAW